MAGGYAVPPEGQLGELVRALDDVRRRIADGVRGVLPR